RTALYFGIACGRELARVLCGEQPRAQALDRYHRFSAAHARAFAWMLRVQRLVPRVAPRLLGPALRAISAKRFVDWSFNHYLAIAHPQFAVAGPWSGMRRGARPDALIGQEEARHVASAAHS
ncbi:MAG: NAD(P)/FAD-dependent oxidoreductase, partial [Solirubrobacteraceae bacterium]